MSKEIEYRRKSERIQPLDVLDAVGDKKTTLVVGGSRQSVTDTVTSIVVPKIIEQGDTVFIANFGDFDARRLTGSLHYAEGGYMIAPVLPTSLLSLLPKEKQMTVIAESLPVNPKEEYVPERIGEAQILTDINIAYTHHDQATDMGKIHNGINYLMGLYEPTDEEIRIFSELQKLRPRDITAAHYKEELKALQQHTRALKQLDERKFVEDTAIYKTGGYQSALIIEPGQNPTAKRFLESYLTTFTAQEDLPNGAPDYFIVTGAQAIAQSSFPSLVRNIDERNYQTIIQTNGIGPNADTLLGKGDITHVILPGLNGIAAENVSKRLGTAHTAITSGSSNQRGCLDTTYSQTFGQQPVIDADKIQFVPEGKAAVVNGTTVFTYIPIHRQGYAPTAEQQPMIEGRETPKALTGGTIIKNPDDHYAVDKIFDLFKRRKNK